MEKAKTTGIQSVAFVSAGVENLFAGGSFYGSGCTVQSGVSPAPSFSDSVTKIRSQCHARGRTTKSIGGLDFA